MGNKIEQFGVTDNGISWFRDGDACLCTYYFGDGVELQKTYVGFPLKYIQKLTFEDLQKG